MTQKKSVKRKSKYSMGKALLIAQAEARVRAAAGNSMSEPEAWKTFNEATAALGFGKPPSGQVRGASGVSWVDPGKATRFDTAGKLGEEVERRQRTLDALGLRPDEPAVDEDSWGKPIAGMYKRVHGYFDLEVVLGRAYDQAASGKGYDRHGRGAKFSKQPTQIISGMLDSDAGLAFQAIKKVNEGMRLEHDAKIKEMLGAINYIASIVIYMEANKK